MAKTYDSKCFDLAEHFMGDVQVHAYARKALTRELACEIQQAVEDFLSLLRTTPAPESREASSVNGGR